MVNGWLDFDAAYTYDWHQWEIVSSEVRVPKLRPVEPGARLYKHLCRSDCFGYKSWLDSWMLMILTYKIDICEMKKLTQGQGHKVKGQGQICNFTKNIVSAINHERVIGFRWYLYIWLILLRRKSWLKVKVTRSKVKVKHAVLRKNFTSVTNRDGSYIYYE